MKGVLFVALLLASFCARAADSYSAYGTYGCGEWNAHSGVEVQRLTGEYYAMGFLSGANMAWKATSGNDVLAGFKVADAFKWLDDYCKHHAMSDLSTATADLFGEMIRRSQSSK